MLGFPRMIIMGADIELVVHLYTSEWLASSRRYSFLSF